MDIQPLKPWNAALRDGLRSGSVAGIASAIVLGLAGRTAARSPAAPINAPSRWIWGDPALRARQVSLRHTAVGYAIHHAASVFWGVIYERYLAADRDRGALRVASGAMATAGLACIVDYRLTPSRLQPGFERHLPQPALAAVYAAIAVGLAAATLARRRHAS